MVKDGERKVLGSINRNMSIIMNHLDENQKKNVHKYDLRPMGDDVIESIENTIN